MAKWSGKVYFPTSSQATRAMASGRYPSVEFAAWKPRPERQRVSVDSTRLEGVLVMLEYGLRVMSDVRLSSLAGVLQNELDRNERRWVQLDVKSVRGGIEQVKQEQGRRGELLNPAGQLHTWFTRPKASSCWTQQDAESLRNDWEQLVTGDEVS